MTYAPDFSGALAKKDRGFQYMKAIMDETSYMVEAPEPDISPLNRIPVRVDYEPETGYHVYRVTAWHSAATIRRWGLMLGDGVHNLRSALDHLACQLACHKAGGADLPGVPEEEARKVQFPLDDSSPAHGDPRRFREGGSLKHVLPEHRTIIYEHQPFGSRYNFGHEMFHPFSQLRKLSNVDKHRTITPIAMLTDRFYVPDVFGAAGGRETERGYRWEEQPAKPGAEVLRVKVWPSSIQLNLPNAGYVSPTPSFQDVLPNGRTYTRSVDIELMHMAFQVKHVIEDFQDLFYRPGMFGRLHGT